MHTKLIMWMIHLAHLVVLEEDKDTCMPEIVYCYECNN